MGEIEGSGVERADGSPVDDDPLALDPETMRRLGYHTVDVLVDGLARLRDDRILRAATPEEMRAHFDEAAPEAGEGFEALLQRLTNDVLPFRVRWDHPRMFGYIPGGGTWPATLADFVVSAWNVDASSWRESAGPNHVELTVLGWFRTWVGYPETAAGILLSGGSAANLTALACAREALVGAMDDRVVAYVSDQSHSSVARAARVLGFRPDQVRVLPSDDGFRLRLDALEGAMDADVRAGRRPLFVAAAAGATNTGAVDPLADLAELCRRREVWLHVDAAYGGFALLTERGRKVLAGIELADSVTLDPHKWLYQPFECGCALVREGDLLRRAFEIVPDYLRDAHGHDGEVNFADRGLQLTRASRALKVWLSIRTFGLGAFRAAIDRSLDLARVAHERVESAPDLQLMAPTELGIVTFRRRFGADRDEGARDSMNAELVARCARSGVGLVSSTRLRGRLVIRMVPMNHTTRADDVLEVLDWLERATIDEPAADAPQALPRERDPGVWLGWVSETAIDARAIRAIPLLRTLTDEQAESLARAVELVTIETGREVVREWEGSRDLYVVLDGTADVVVGHQVVSELGPGDVFGEVAALDWGAEFGYARTATVTAVSPIRALVVPHDALLSLLPAAPEVDRELRQLAGQRLRRQSGSSDGTPEQRRRS